jgi:XTP/dITP diphosphohydrolase
MEQERRRAAVRHYPTMDIVLATRNRKKVEEIRRIAAGLPITVLSLDDFPDCPEVVEDQDTFEGNASKKALEASDKP